MHTLFMTADNKQNLLTFITARLRLTDLLCLGRLKSLRSFQKTVQLGMEHLHYLMNSVKLT